MIAFPSASRCGWARRRIFSGSIHRDGFWWKDRRRLDFHRFFFGGANVDVQRVDRSRKLRGIRKIEWDLRRVRNNWKRQRKQRILGEAQILNDGRISIDFPPFISFGDVFLVDLFSTKTLGVEFDVVVELNAVANFIPFGEWLLLDRFDELQQLAGEKDACWVSVG